MTMLKTILVSVNLLIGIALLLLSWVWLRASPVISIILLAAAVDQFEDVYFLTTGKSLFPRPLIGFDVGAEFLQFVLGIALIFFSISYIDRLESNMVPLFTGIVGFAVCFSACYDIASISDRYRFKSKIMKRMEECMYEEGFEKNRRRTLRRT